MKEGPLANYIAFAVLMVTTVLGYQTFWGLLFLYWTVPNFISGRAFLVSVVTRQQDPVLYWLIQVAWIVLGISMILSDVFPQWA
ncbi:MAG: hypothetical protein AAGD06_24660 [Acidobacteriota bacterium]